MASWPASAEIINYYQYMGLDPLYNGNSFWWRISPQYRFNDKVFFKYILSIRNRYNDVIHFSYEVYNREPNNARTTHRTDLKPGALSSGVSDFYMENSNSIYVFVDSVRFIKDGLQPYYECDK